MKKNKIINALYFNFSIFNNSKSLDNIIEIFSSQAPSHSSPAIGHVRLIISNAKNATCLIPTSRRNFIFYKEVEVQPSDEFGVMVELIDGSLDIAIPYFHGHVVA
jgi:hypothetical protein